MAFWEYKSKNTVFISSAMKSTNSLLQCLLQGSSENFSILEKCHHLVRTMTQGSRTNPVRSKNRKVNTSSLEKSHVFQVMILFLWMLQQPSVQKDFKNFMEVMCPQSLKCMHGTQSHEHAEAPAAALDSVGLSVPDARQLLHYHLPSSHEAGGLSCSVFIWGPSWPCGQ